MASYQEGDEYLGAFLPGLTRILSQPVKTVAKATTTFFKSPVKGIGQLLMAPVDMAKAVKFAAMGSAPIFKKKAVTNQAVTNQATTQATKTRASAMIKKIMSTASQKATGAISKSSYVDPTYQSLAPDYGIPTVSMPQAQSVESIQETATDGSPKKSAIPIIVGVGAIAAILYFKGKKHVNIPRK